MNLGLMNRRAAQKPSLYDAEIEYLESDGRQYIDLGIVPLVTDSIYCEFMLVSPLSSRDGSAAIFGTFSAWAKNGFALVGSPAKVSSNIYFLRGNTEANASVVWNNVCDKWQVATINSNTATFLGKTLTNNGTSTITQSAYLFAIHYNGVYGLGSKKRIRIFQHKRNNKLMLDLISVRKGNVGYFYDKVSDRLFADKSGIGFILGPDK